MSRLSRLGSQLRSLVLPAAWPRLSGMFSLVKGGGEAELGGWQRQAATPAPMDAVLSFSAAYACVNVIAGDIAKLPLRVMQRGPRGGARVAVRHPMQRVLQRPNRFQTRLQFMQWYAVSKLVSGNTIVFKEFDKAQRVSELYTLLPGRTQTLVSDEGDVLYKIAPEPTAGITDQMAVPADRVIHDVHLPLFHPLVGVSPLVAAGVSAGTGAAIVSEVNTLHANMSRPSGVLKSPGKVSPETAQRLSGEFNNNYRAGGFGRVAVLGDGLEWQALTISAEDAQMIETLRWTVEDVARVFGVPMYRIAEQKVTYRNAEAAARAYYQGTLQYHLEAIELALDRGLGLDGVDTWCEFDLDALFRMEQDMRFTSYATALQAGFLSINEVREREGEAPVPGGDEPMVQMQYVPLSVAVDRARNPTPPPPAAEPPPASGDEVDPEDEPDDEPDPADLAKHIAALEAAVAGVVRDAGVWHAAPPAAYAAGSLVTHKGGAWIAQRSAGLLEPGTDDSGWRLIHKTIKGGGA